MSVFDAARTWLGRLLGGSEADDADDAAGAATADASESSGAEPAYECAVCGTRVSDPDGPCPLCNGTDVVSAGSDEPTGDGPGPGGTTTRVASDDASDRLREVREGNVLAANADRWERVDDGFRVEVGDDVRYVETRAAVRRLLAPDGDDSGDRDR
ncbi:MAG: hypothetical protein ABEJ70_02495 [Halobacteriaceae archaeon]